ncbi:hypothetical protein NXS19_002216 [Fusarium pseudograminearum]|nr:hypothetical protein NXS19_002216 [Fusarium pseudograminearum]
MSSLAGSQHILNSNAAVTINHLPNEILVKIYHCLANLQDPAPLPVQMEADIPEDKLQYDIWQYSDLILDKNYTALTLCLVSRRFYYIFKQFTINNVVLVQSRLLLLQPKNQMLTEMQSTSQFKEAEKLVTSMERLHNMIDLNPGLVQNCKSLCLAYRQVKVPPRYIPDRAGVYQPYLFPQSLYEDMGIDESEYEDFEDDEFKLEETIVPAPSWLNKMYSCFSHVTDLQLHSNYYRSLPDITPALSSFSNLTTLRATGYIDYPSFFRQLISLESTLALQTLDLSGAPANTWSHGFTPLMHTLMDITGTASFTRLLTGPCTDPQVLRLIVAWPRRLERLVLQTSPEQMTIIQVYNGSLQKILDSQKDSLTHLRIEGEYQLGLQGFDLRDFPCLEHLALDSATISNIDPSRDDSSTLPDIEQHILAPRLRSLLWVMPSKQPETGDFFGLKNQSRVESVMIGLKQQQIKYREAGKQWSLKRIWLQTLVQPLESLPTDAQVKFASHLRWIASFDEFFKDSEPTLQLLPPPKGGMYVLMPPVTDLFLR